MVIYLDVLIFENIIVNMFLLHVTAKTMRTKVKIRYLLIAAFVGSMYVLVLIYPQLKYFSGMFFKIIIAAIIILISFRKKNVLFNIKALCIFILYSMLVAGACMFIQYNQSYDLWHSAIINFSYKKLLIALMIIYMLFDRIIVYIKDRKQLSNLIYDVDIILKSSQKSIKAFLDTGNELREPATNLPVIVVEKAVFSDVDLSLYDKFYIPYRVVNGQNGNLEGFKPDYIKVHYGSEINKKEVIIAFCEEQLSSINDYKGLLSRGVIT